MSYSEDRTAEQMLSVSGGVGVSSVLSVSVGVLTLVVSMEFSFNFFTYIKTFSYSLGGLSCCWFEEIL